MPACTELIFIFACKFSDGSMVKVATLHNGFSLSESERANNYILLPALLLSDCEQALVEQPGI